MAKIGYNGDILGIQAWEWLKTEPTTVLVDVRTEPEWLYVGMPELSSVNKSLQMVCWQNYPRMEVNSEFAEQIAAAGIEKNQRVLLICRSGVRSKAAANLLAGLGYVSVYNITDGFEGQIDSLKHRGHGGWRALGLPWVQG